MSSIPRVVHGTTAYGDKIVRRDTEWFAEDVDGEFDPRSLTLDDAVKAAVAGRAFLGQPGGEQFDAKVRERRSSLFARTPVRNASR